MSQNKFILSLGVISVCAFTLLGCQAIKSNGKKLTGGVSLQQEQITGVALGAPRVFYIEDFQLDRQNFQGNQGVLNRVPIASRLLNRHQNNPDDQAAILVNTLSEALVEEFNKNNLSAQRLASSDAGLPKNGWLIKGVFTEVDEGNRLKRAVIGFGQGSTQMTVQVGVSDLASSHPEAPFIIFGTIKDPSKIPGAVVTMNPYVAAARFVMEKNATQKDIKNTAKLIVAEILKYKAKFTEQLQREKSSSN